MSRGPARCARAFAACRSKRPRADGRPSPPPRLHMDVHPQPRPFTALLLPQTTILVVGLGMGDH
eukprot:181393-Chlamydomonas_euryale.AAC.1